MSAAATRSPLGAHVVIVAVACAGCASIAGREEAIASPGAIVAARDDGTARHDEIVRTPAAPAGGVPGSSGDGSTPSVLATALHDRDVARTERALACGNEKRCVAAPMGPAVDVAALAPLLKVRARDAVSRRVQQSAARALIESALDPGSADRNARRRRLTFADGGAVFALDDATALFSQAKRSERARWLGAARAAAVASSSIDAEERALIDRAAASVGLRRGDLLARRVGLDEASLRKLAENALVATAPLLAPIASDVTLLPDAIAAGSEEGRAQASLAAARVSADPIFLAAAADAASLRARSSADAVARVRALVVELRRSALATLAILDGADADRADALASRILDDAAAAVPGASALLPPLSGGAAIDRFVAALRAPSVGQVLWNGAPLEDCRKQWDDAAPVDELGFPEAFVEVVKVLPELAR